MFYLAMAGTRTIFLFPLNSDLLPLKRSLTEFQVCLRLIQKLNKPMRMTSVWNFIELLRNHMPSSGIKNLRGPSLR